MMVDELGCHCMLDRPLIVSRALRCSRSTLLPQPVWPSELMGEVGGWYGSRVTVLLGEVGEGEWTTVSQNRQSQYYWWGNWALTVVPNLAKGLVPNAPERAFSSLHQGNKFLSGMFFDLRVSHLCWQRYLWRAQRCRCDGWNFQSDRAGRAILGQESLHRGTGWFMSHVTWCTIWKAGMLITHEEEMNPESPQSCSALNKFTNCGSNTHTHTLTDPTVRDVQSRRRRPGTSLCSPSNSWLLRLSLLCSSKSFRAWCGYYSCFETKVQILFSPYLCIKKKKQLKKKLKERLIWLFCPAGDLSAGSLVMYNQEADILGANAWSGGQSQLL